MTQRDQHRRLAAAVRAAGLRLSPVEIETLVPAWRRYRVLVDAFLDATPSDDPEP